MIWISLSRLVGLDFVVMEWGEIKRQYKEDDYFAWIVFLTFISPVPFIYAFISDKMVSATGLGLAVYSFALNIVFWLILMFLLRKTGALGMGKDGGREDEIRQ